jgi:predicted nucleic acid-binding protein
MDWPGLFDRAPTVDRAAIETALSSHRDGGSAATEAADLPTPTEPREPQPTRIVADADVLVADLLGDSDARAAIDVLWQHSWTTLVASDDLLAEAEAVIEAVADSGLATDWRAAIEAWREPVVHPPGDHPALASAYRGGAMHLLSFDETLTDSQAGAALNQRVSVSVRSPAAFAHLFDPEGLYETVDNDPYGGPDREPRDR